MITLPISGSDKKIAIAWSLDQGSPQSNQIALSIGTDTASSTLLTAMLGTPQNAADGWHPYTNYSIVANYFMSSTKENAGIIVELKPSNSVQDGKYYIQPIASEYQNMYLKLAHTNTQGASQFDIILDHMEETEKERYQWYISYFSTSSSYLIASVYDDDYLWVGTQYPTGSYWLDARTLAGWTSLTDANHWRWDVDSVGANTFMFTNIWSKAEVNLQECRKDWTPTTGTCTKGGFVRIMNPTSTDATITTQFKLIPVL